MLNLIFNSRERMLQIEDMKRFSTFSFNRNYTALIKYQSTCGWRILFSRLWGNDVSCINTANQWFFSAKNLLKRFVAFLLRKPLSKIAKKILMKNETIPFFSMSRIFQVIRKQWCSAIWALEHMSFGKHGHQKYQKLCSWPRDLHRKLLKVLNYENFCRILRMKYLFVIWILSKSLWNISSFIFVLERENFTIGSEIVYFLSYLSQQVWKNKTCMYLNKNDIYKTVFFYWLNRFKHSSVLSSVYS